MKLHLVFVLICACICTTPAYTQTRKINTLKKERTTLQNKINKNEKQLRNTQNDVRTHLTTLNKLNADISQQQKYVDGISAEVGTLNNKLNALEKQMTAMRTELEEYKARYKKSVMYMYHNRLQQNKLLFIFSAQNFRQMYRRMHYVNEYAKYQRAQGEIIKRKEMELAEMQNKLLGVKSDKSKLLAQGKKEQTKLETQQQERKQVVDKLQKQQKTLQGIIATDRKRYDQLNANIDRLVQIEIAAAERRRKQAEARAKAAAEAKARAEQRAKEEAARKASTKNSKATAKSAKANTSGKATAKAETRSKASSTEAKMSVAENTDYKLSNSFAANKGRLPIPITGAYRITSRYGQNSVEGLSGVKLDNKGINLTGQSGATARAIFDGEVSAVFSFGGMMNILVRHGSYISVYCNLSSASVRQGQQIKARQTLGAVARDPASGAYVLHFQLRRETTKLNPESWLAR